MTFSRRSHSIVRAVLVLGLLAGGAWWRLRPPFATERGTSGDDSVADPGLSTTADAAFSIATAQPVRGARVVRDTLWLSVDAAGRARAVHRTRLRAPVSGVIESVAVRENDAVSWGERLLQIDTTLHALSVARAQSDLLRARAAFEERVLFDDRITDPAVRERRARVARSVAGLAQAEIALREAVLALDRSRVRAPFGGRVADLKVVAGEHVAAGAELMTVVDLDPIAVEVAVLESELGRLGQGRWASVRFAAFPGETFPGRISTLNPVVDPSTRTGRVTVRLENPDERIKPGMYAEVVLAATWLPDRLLVPREAILERGEGRRRTMLFVFEETGEGGRAEWRYVETGQANHQLVEVVPAAESTVSPGEVVLVDGHHYLAHGTRVRLVDDVAAEGGRPGG